MSCCSVNNKNGIGCFFSKEAKNFNKRYTRKGFEKSQKQILEYLISGKVNGLSILEIGCGTGHLHRYLLNHGASSAIGVDLSEEMINLAKKHAINEKLEPRVTYYTGDFIDFSNQINKCDIVLLDKVICCYPEAMDLVFKSMQKAKQLYIYTIPRNKWWIRYGIKVTAYFLQLFRSGFFPYFHDHEKITSLLKKHSFYPDSITHSFAWETYIFSYNKGKKRKTE